MTQEEDHWHLQWSNAPDGTVTIYGGMRPDSIDYSRPLVHGSGSEWRISMEDGCYFCLEADSKRHLIGSRCLPFNTTHNFRELGGYPLGNGRQLRWGCLYRSGHLADLDDGDTALLAALCIGTIIDFRHDSEVQSQPHRLPVPSPQLTALPITPGNFGGYQHWLDPNSNVTISPDDVAQKMCEINRDLAIGQSEHYQNMFRQLLAPRHGAVLLNCTAGKDRTGFGVALILLALGATRETVMADYLLSAELLGTRANMMRVLERYGLSASDLMTWQPILTVRREYLQHAFDAIDEHYASTADYLEQRLGVDAAMRAELHKHFVLPT